MAVSEDRLSPLPDGLLLHILSLTESYKTAVVSSVLSKRWRTLYPHLLGLTLKFGDVFGNKHLIRSMTDSSRLVFVEKFQKIVSRALLVHRKNLETLSLDTFLSKLEGTTDSFSRDSLNDWLENAAYRNVQNLSLFNLWAVLRFTPHIPNHLFSCTSLVTLHLSRFTVFDLDSCRMFFTGFPHLKSCSMKACVIDDLATFLDNCPVLHTLELFMCEADSGFTISSKSILVLNIHMISTDYKDFAITVVCPKLVHIDLKCQGLLRCAQLSSLGRLLSSLDHAQLSENGDLISVGLYLYNRDWSDISYVFSKIRMTTFSTLKTMELWRVKTYPTSIWIAISGLPLPCTLDLRDCIFLENEMAIRKVRYQIIYS